MKSTITDAEDMDWGAVTIVVDLAHAFENVQVLAWAKHCVPQRKFLVRCGCSQGCEVRRFVYAENKCRAMRTGSPEGAGAR